MKNLSNQIVVVRSQEELDSLDPSEVENVRIEFGTERDPAIITDYFNDISVVGDHAAEVGVNCKVRFCNRSICVGTPVRSIIIMDDDASATITNDGKNSIYAGGRSRLYISGDNTVIANCNASIHVNTSTVFAPLITAYDNTEIELHGYAVINLYDHSLASVYYKGRIQANMYDCSTMILHMNRGDKMLHNINGTSNNTRVVFAYENDIKSTILNNGYELYDDNHIVLYSPCYIADGESNIEKLKEEFCTGEYILDNSGCGGMYLTLNEAVATQSIHGNRPIVIFKYLCDINELNYSDDRSISCSKYSIIDIIDPYKTLSVCRYLYPLTNTKISDTNFKAKGYRETV